MIKYVFADDETVAIKNKKRANPQRIGEELERISQLHGGKLTPRAVMQEARTGRNPLHPFFEWDDKKAAESYRLEQARHIIRIVRVEDAEMENAPRAFLSVTDKAGTAYYSVQTVRGNSDLQMIVLRQAERDLDAFNKRYRELTDVCDLVREAREKVAAKRVAAEAAVQ